MDGFLRDQRAQPLHQEMTNASSTVTSALTSPLAASRLAPAQSLTPPTSAAAEPRLKSARASLDSDHKSVFEIVVRYLSVKSLGRAICVCKSWRELAREDQGLWRRHCELRYPAVLSPAIARQIADTCGFRRFFLYRLLSPARAPPLPFTMADVTFFLDITYHASPVFSHVFRYQGGSAVVPFSADCYVDSGAVFPSSDALDKDALRRTLSVNWTAVRRTDGKGTCIVRSAPDRSCASTISFDALLAANAKQQSQSQTQIQSQSQLQSQSQQQAPSQAGVGAVAVNSPRPSAAQAAASTSQLPALKLVFNTNLGGPIGEQFYGMMKVSFALPLRERFLHQKGSGSSPGNSGHTGSRSSKELTPVNVLSRSGGLEIDVSALKDRLGGTVRVDIADKEFLLILSALEWV